MGPAGYGEAPKPGAARTESGEERLPAAAEERMEREGGGRQVGGRVAAKCIESSKKRCSKIAASSKKRCGKIAGAVRRDATTVAR